MDRRIALPMVIGAIVAALAAAGLAAAPPRTIAVDALVVRGTPAGIAAAAGAARAGARVHIVEPRSKLGGDITWAWLTTFDMNLSPDGIHLTRGIFSDYYRLLGLSFDLEEAVHKLTWAVYRERLANVTEHAPLLRPLLDGTRVIGAEFEDRGFNRTLTVRAKVSIDATDDAEFAAAAGVLHVLGREGAGGERWMQPATLIFRLSGVDWVELTTAIMARRNGDTVSWGVNGKAAWGFWEAMRGYKPSQPDAGVLGLNLALQHDGSVLVNTLQIFRVDGTVPASLEDGLAKAKRELPSLVQFMRTHIPGLAQAQLADHAPALYVRETRHIAGLQTLTVDDIILRRVFPDRIAVASYPIDIHPYRPTWTSPYALARHVYTIPLKTLVPKDVQGLLVASRSFSATSEAAGSARVIPTTMAMGQAAGVVAAICASAGCTPAAVARTPALVKKVQLTLMKQGAYLGAEPLP
ncbi:MAG: FAD-dependent oxidoreductase [Armatimonadetes bacterium]|nr:FAD-dependent oxidoreductase [Armatimonadota bacterium]